ncbi:MAG: hypothetical protein EXS55_02660 [Candidatus Magasanikbacteria bacterium]|nr:hypothetical protein [Candidatus Magasanikbacteria bacterium]
MKQEKECAMSNGKMNPFERLLKLLAAILKMVVDKVRDIEQVNRYLQRVVDEEKFVLVIDAPPRAASVSTEPTGGHAAEWTRFYHEVFGLKVDLSKVELSPERPGFGWAVFVAEGLTLNQVWAKCGELFPAESYIGDDFDRAVPKNDRTSKTAYAKRFRNRVEADQEHKNVSANDLTKQDVQSITLLERILLELWYFWKTGGGHLDLINVTLCAGSRCGDGDVPDVGWNDYQFQVCACGPDYSLGGLRARSAG